MFKKTAFTYAPYYIITIIIRFKIQRTENIMLKLGDLLNLVKYPSLTEKSINLYGDRQYTFIVDRSLTKTQIKYIIENF
jgi:hypothetical protein